MIRAAPGESIRITYRNEMSPEVHAKCATGQCMNMTNLHFHALHVSPDCPQDDVLSMMAMPGESLQYKVEIPKNQPPGLYWYHPHAHGESYKQVLDGMSGAIVVEGLLDRVRAALRGRADYREKKMFGGITFMVSGKMCVSVGRERIMCRIDPAFHESA